VDGHNVVRAGDVLLNHVIRQEGYYGIYQGRFLDETLRVLLGARRDIYNATESTYKRVNVTDAFLEESALEKENL
jgi:hypothetical protein